MPDRTKLTLQVYRKVMLAAPDNNYVVAAIADGKIIGAGNSIKAALDDAERKRPDIGIGKLAILFKDPNQMIP